MRSILLALLLFAILAAGALQAGQPCRFGPHALPMAESRDDLDRVISIMDARDRPAYDKMVATGLVRFTTPGAQVYLEEATWAGRSRVRMPGEINTYWTLSRALECK